MCGIAGIIELHGRPVEKEMLAVMVGAVAHRGPDGEGMELAGPVGLGHRRLAILGLGEQGHQPMVMKKWKLSIVHNGEIYNYVEIRHELERKGYKFTTDTDTEVILAAYHAWGEECVQRFNGMWSFAIHDKKEERLFCSRDRFGVKPFYYIDTPKRFAFGSEIRQLLPLLTRNQVNRPVLETFLLSGVCELTDDTFFKSVHKLPGGHNLIYDIAKRSFEIRPYYRLQKKGDVASLHESDAIEAFGALFYDAVKLRLRSDVKVGTCLSGGLDSSSIAALAALMYSGGTFTAITAVSEQESNDESFFAQAAANHSGLLWLSVCPGYEDFLNLLPKVVSAQEEPFGGPSLVMQYVVMQTAREQGIPVLLDGQGGDETLLGYERYVAPYAYRRLRENGLFSMIGAMAAARRNNSLMTMGGMMRHMMGGISPRLRHYHYARKQHHLKHRPHMPQQLRDTLHMGTDLFTLQSLEMRSVSLPALLRYEDKNAMAHGVETRLPFVDYRLVEFALSLPLKYKMRDGWTKWILRTSMEKYLPPQVAWRKNKLGFEAPEGIWLGQHVQTMRDTVLGSSLIADVADMGKLAQGYEKLGNSARWRLYSAALWEKAFNVSA